MSGLSVVLPVWGREELTYQVLENIKNQTYTDAELFILGDNCPVFEAALKKERFINVLEEIQNKFTKVEVLNLPYHDGTSAQAINYSISRAEGEYFIWISNDDKILDFHFEKYYNKTKESGTDLGYFDTLLDYGSSDLVKRSPFLAFNAIGHSELCVKTEIAKKVPPHSRNYGHDWEFIDWIMKNGFKCDYIFGKPSYIVNMKSDRERSWG